jgi:hypothetical protein
MPHPLRSRRSEGAWNTRAGAPASWRSRVPTGWGQRRLRPGGVHRRRATVDSNYAPCRPCSSSDSTRRPSCPPRARRRARALGHAGSGTSTARSGRASTAARSRPAPTLGWTSPMVERILGERLPTADGTARSRTDQCGRRSTRRSTCSTGCSIERRWLRRGEQARRGGGSTCSSVACSVASTGESSIRRTATSRPLLLALRRARALDYSMPAQNLIRDGEAVEEVRSSSNPTASGLDRIHRVRSFDFEDGVRRPVGEHSPRPSGARLVGPRARLGEPSRVGPDPCSAGADGSASPRQPEVAPLGARAGTHRCNFPRRRDSSST